MTLVIDGFEKRNPKRPIRGKRARRGELFWAHFFWGNRDSHSSIGWLLLTKKTIRKGIKAGPIKDQPSAEIRAKRMKRSSFCFL